MDKGNSNASAGLVRPADDGHLGDYISYVLLHVLVDILNTFSYLKRRQRKLQRGSFTVFLNENNVIIIDVKLGKFALTR